MFESHCVIFVNECNEDTSESRNENEKRTIFDNQRSGVILKANDSDILVKAFVSIRSRSSRDRKDEQSFI